MPGPGRFGFFVCFSMSQAFDLDPVYGVMLITVTSSPGGAYSNWSLAEEPPVLSFWALPVEPPVWVGETSPEKTTGYLYRSR